MPTMSSVTRLGLALNGQKTGEVQQVTVNRIARTVLDAINDHVEVSTGDWNTDTRHAVYGTVAEAFVSIKDEPETVLSNTARQILETATEMLRRIHANNETFPALYFVGVTMAAEQVLKGNEDLARQFFDTVQAK